MSTIYTGLEAGTALTGAEIIPMEQGGEIKQTTTQDIADLAGGAAPYTSIVLNLNCIAGVPLLLDVLQDTANSEVYMDDNLDNTYTLNFSGNSLFYGKKVHFTGMHGYTSTVNARAVDVSIPHYEAGVLKGFMNLYLSFYTNIIYISFVLAGALGVNVAPNTLYGTATVISFPEIRIYP